MGVADQMADQMADQNMPVGQSEEEKRRRRLLWLLLGAAIVLLFLLFVVCSGGGEDDPVAAPTTTTTVPVTAAPTTVRSAAAPTAPAPPLPTTTVVATTQPAPTTTTEPGPIDVSGVWAFLIDVTKATGICSGEENEKVQAEEVTIHQDGAVLIVTGLNETDPPWQGEIVGNTVTFGGERDEDRGRTTAMFTLTVDDDGATFTGEEVWAWTGPGGSCSNSLSEVSAHRG